VGPSVKGFSMRDSDGKRRKFSRDAIKKMIANSVRDQFETLGQAAKGVDLIMVGGNLQSAAHSIAEALRIPYAYAAYCAGTLRSDDHPPPRTRSQTLPRFVNRLLWTFSEYGWNAFFRKTINEQRALLGLAAIEHVPRYVCTERPWLASDALIDPAASNNKLSIYQTGAWLLKDSTPLPTEIETFLKNGEPPIYFGFGSMTKQFNDARPFLQAARKLGRRAIISKGWANLHVADDGDDYLLIDDTNHSALFPRVAAIVHHGGAGTTTTAARFGKPQLIVPQLYDQFYFAHRVTKLGIGSSMRNRAAADTDQLAKTLQHCLGWETVARARTVAGKVKLNGAAITADKLIAERL
jgi:vancomycin aglycone glucosyltransferase